MTSGYWHAPLFPLAVFALPGVAVYDGERLFLTSFPLWAMFVGRGWMTVWNLLSRWTGSLWRFFATLLLCGRADSDWQAAVSDLSPCRRSIFVFTTKSVQVCFSRTVDRAGLEIDYWGEGVTRQGCCNNWLTTLPEGSTVAIVPTMHQFQADDYRRQSPILRAHNIK